MVREDDLRATFSALHAEGTPPGAVTAADLITRGRAVRSRRRTIAVAGTGLATVGVVALALAVLPGAAPVEPLLPGSSVPTTTAPSPSPSPSSVPPPTSSNVEPPPSSPPTPPRNTTSPSLPPVQDPPPTSHPVLTGPTGPPSTTATPGSSVSNAPSTSR